MNLEISINDLKNIYGYEKVKEELSLIKNWFTDKEILNNEKITIPKGVILYGPPGCGKTLFLREFSESLNVPIFVIKGGGEEEISSIFDEARKEESAVVLIDEIDLLCDDNVEIIRILQQELDGINSKGKILVLATTNDISKLPPPLLRPGRLDKKIEISLPDFKSRIFMFKKFLEDLDVAINDIDFNLISKISHGCSAIDIKSICNDAYLRCKNNITTFDLEKSYSRVMDEFEGDISPDYKNMRVAIHEAGHIVMSLNFKDNFSFYRASFLKFGGVSKINETDERVDNIKKRKEKIMISLGGYLAEELFYGYHDVGSYHDLSKTYEIATRLVDRCCVNGIDSYIAPYFDNSNRFESLQKRRKNELYTVKLVKILAHRAKKILKKNKEYVKMIAQTFYEKGELNYLEMPSYCN